MSTTTGNFVVGNATLSSDDASIEINGGPAQGQIDFRVAGGAPLRTLTQIYAYGLANGTPPPDPNDDNYFAMDSGNLRFPGYKSWGGPGRLDAAIEWFGDRDTLHATEPAFGLISQATVHNGGNAYYWNLEQNDPNWNGSFDSLSVTWHVEKIVFSLDPTQGQSHDGQTYGSRKYDSFGAGPFVPGSGEIGEGLRAGYEMWNSHDGLVDVQWLSSFGWTETRLVANQNGASPAWLTHWNPVMPANAAGDGPAWIIDRDGRFVRNDPAAILQAQQQSNDVNGAWAWSLQAWDGATLQEVGLVHPTFGLLLEQGGLQLPENDSTTFPVSDAASLRMIWDPTTGKIMVSVAGGAYAALGTVS